MRRATHITDLGSTLIPFLSTLSLRRATTPRLSRVVPTPIFLSTLSLRRATQKFSAQRILFNFYPRSPCGERPQDLIAKELALAFLSTLSLRRATGILGRRLRYRKQFLSTLSLRRATNARPETRRHDAISIHALLAESDTYRILRAKLSPISIHALLAESD